VFFFLPVAVSAKKNKDTAFPSHTSHVWMNMFWIKKLEFLPNPWAKDMTGNGWKLGWSHWLDSEAKMLPCFESDLDLFARPAKWKRNDWHS